MNIRTSIYHRNGLRPQPDHNEYRVSVATILARRNGNERRATHLRVCCATDYSTRDDAMTMRASELKRSLNPPKVFRSLTHCRLPVSQRVL